MIVHLAAGLCTIAFVFPALDAPARRARIRSWSRKLLDVLHVDLRLVGTLAQPNVVVVANHVSWLDIFALHAVGPVRFIAKAEIARWPVLGRLVAGVGTLFIERERRRDTHRVNRDIAQALADGDIVAVFPEGTVGDGALVLPFKGSLLQPIVEAAGYLQPIAIRYREPDGKPSTVPAYDGDITFIYSFWRIGGARALAVELIAGTPLPARGRHRRDLAREAESLIRAALASPAAGFPPDTRADPADGSP
jgi:1-acyl-sn-glycerol-3-phosphate acyltransferase